MKKEFHNRKYKDKTLVEGEHLNELEPKIEPKRERSNFVRRSNTRDGLKGNVNVERVERNFEKNVERVERNSEKSVNVDRRERNESHTFASRRGNTKDSLKGNVNVERMDRGSEKNVERVERNSETSVNGDRRDRNESHTSASRRRPTDFRRSATPHAESRFYKNPRVKENQEVRSEKKGEEDKLYIMPLGGLEEIGKNSTLIQYKDEMILVDAGLAFPDENMLGIDVVMPDYTFLLKNQDKLKGLVITHGHEDHIGSVAFLFQKLADTNIPIYGSRLAVGLIKSKFRTGGRTKTKKLNYQEVSARTKVRIGKYFEVEFIRITHSTPDAFTLAIKTPVGTVLHTGDFKFDLTPIDGAKTDFFRLAEKGENGVLLLMADSTNSAKDGFTASERTVGKALDNIISNAKGRVIIASFSSHIHRVQQAINAAVKHGRKVAMDGKSMIRTFEVAMDLGYTDIPKGALISLAAASKMPDHKVAIICTGTQGEAMSVLSRMANGLHKFIKVEQGDTVIISANPIPGNEKSVTGSVNGLLKKGANVIFEKKDGIHVSGHASADDLKLMFNLIKPKFLMPVHGEFVNLKKHEQLGIEYGIPAENILIAKNGDKIELTQDSLQVVGAVESGIVMVDNSDSTNGVEDSILRERQLMSTDGVVVILATLNARTGKLQGNPEFITKGFMHPKEIDAIVRDLNKIIVQELTGGEGRVFEDFYSLKKDIRDIVLKYFRKNTSRNPMILPLVTKI